MYMRVLLTILFGVVLLVCPSADIAATCEGAEYKAFDFWLGEWDVYTTAGKLAGSSRIERGYAGCVIHENYSNARGYRGESLNMYDARRKVWHQTWVDNSGLLLKIEGGIRDGSMVLEGTLLNKEGKPTKQRITWTPNPGGTVRQHWESADSAGVWSTVFDGEYRRSAD
jgi:hypothetical protein